MEYLTVKDPAILWKKLKKRHEHQKTIILPQARYEWTQLRLQDYMSVVEYDLVLCKITSRLQLCGGKIIDFDMLEKTFTIFYKDNFILI